MRTLSRVLLVGALVLFFLLLYRPEFVANAGNALLRSANNNAVVGSMQLLPKLQGQGSDLQLNLQGLRSSAKYVVTLDQGKCGGNVLMTLDEISADTQGNITATLSKADVNAMALKQNVWVNVHQGSATGASVACGQVQINSAVAAEQSSSGSNNNTTATKNTQNPLSAPTTGVSGFPQTGAGPAGRDTYNNYKFPRKY
jgi:hypothetical protein